MSEPFNELRVYYATILQSAAVSHMDAQRFSGFCDTQKPVMLTRKQFSSYNSSLCSTLETNVNDNWEKIHVKTPVDNYHSVERIVNFNDTVQQLAVFKLFTKSLNNTKNQHDGVIINISLSSPMSLTLPQTSPTTPF